MPTFTCKNPKKTVIDGNERFAFTLHAGATAVASADLIKVKTETFWRMDNYTVETAYRKRGYPYALTYCMLRAIRLKGGTEAIIPSAHGGMIGVGAEGFTEIPNSRQYKTRKKNSDEELMEDEKEERQLTQVSFQTADLLATELAQKTKMEGEYDLQEQVSQGCCSCCYITTAVCKALELGDDCDELTTLRAFRDQVLLKTELGMKDVARYYALAPAIVVAIDLRPDALDIYQDLYQRYISPSVAALLRGQPDQSHALFREMVEETSKIYLSVSR